MRRFARMLLAAAKTLSNVRVDPGNVEALRSLGQSYLRRPVHPLVAKEDMTVLDGWRRILGLQLIGETEAEFLITDEELSEGDIVEIGLVTAMHRADLTSYEKWKGCEKILELHPGWLGKDLAAHLNIDASTVTRLLAPAHTLPAVQEAFKAGALSLSQVYTISKASEQEQHRMLANALNGASRDDLEHTSRKSRNRHVRGVKLSRIKAPLASGVEVVISGKELGLDDVIESLGDLLKTAKKASESGWDVKTWSAVLKDKSKAGV